MSEGAGREGGDPVMSFGILMVALALPVVVFMMATVFGGRQ